MIVGATMTRTGQRKRHPAGVGRKPVLGVKSLGEVNAPHATTRRQLSNHTWIVIRTVRAGRIVHTCNVEVHVVLLIYCPHVSAYGPL